MEHIEINKLLVPRKESANLEPLHFESIGSYWSSVCGVIPEALRLLPNKAYVGSPILNWYDKIVLYHDKKMNEFNKMFSWLKK